MFVVTLSKASVKKAGVGALCCALVVFSAMLGSPIWTCKRLLQTNLLLF